MDKERGRLSQYRCAQRPAASEQRPRSSARPVLSTGVDRSSVRANRSKLHPSRGPASPPTVIAKKKSTKRNQQKEINKKDCGGRCGRCLASRARGKIAESWLTAPPFSPSVGARCARNAK